MQRQSSLSTRIWQLTWPAIVSNISIPLLGLADAAILGHLDSARYLAAVTLGGAVLSFVYWGFNFLRMGTTGLVAREVGAGRRDDALAVLARSLIVALGLAVLVMLSRPLWLGFGLGLMGASGTGLELAQSYSTIRTLSAPAALATYAVLGWFIGSGTTRWPMVILVLTNGFNVLLDYLFILQFGWGSDGAAWATVIAEYSGCALALAAVASVSNSSLTDKIRQALSSRTGYRALLIANQHLLVRTMTLLFHRASCGSGAAQALLPRSVADRPVVYGYRRAVQPCLRRIWRVYFFLPDHAARGAGTARALPALGGASSTAGRAQLFA